METLKIDDMLERANETLGDDEIAVEVSDCTEPSGNVKIARGICSLVSTFSTSYMIGFIGGAFVKMAPGWWKIPAYIGNIALTMAAAPAVEDEFEKRIWNGIFTNHQCDTVEDSVADMILAIGEKLEKHKIKREEKKKAKENDN